MDDGRKPSKYFKLPKTAEDNDPEDAEEEVFVCGGGVRVADLVPHLTPKDP